jgi:hypothetical protein
MWPYIASQVRLVLLWGALLGGWPGWATSSTTMFTYLFGGPVNAIAIGLLLLIGLGLALAPVVYDAVERVIFLKVAAIVTFIAPARRRRSRARASRSSPTSATSCAGDGGGGSPTSSRR